MLNSLNNLGRDHQLAPSHDQVPAADPGLDPGHDPSHGPSQRPGPDQAAESVRSQAQEADQIKSDIIMIIIIIFCNNKYVPYQHDLMNKISTINYRKLNTFQMNIIHTNTEKIFVRSRCRRSKVRKLSTMKMDSRLQFSDNTKYFSCESLIKSLTI